MPTDQIFDAVVVSHLGRAVEVAEKLARAGLKVAFLDVTSQLGESSEEQGYPPFGHFGENDLQYSESDFLKEAVEVPFSFWFKNGPFDFDGPLASYYRGKLGSKLRSMVEGAVDFSTTANTELEKINLELSQPVDSSLGSQKFSQFYFQIFSSAFAHADEMENFSHFPFLKRFRLIENIKKWRELKLEWLETLGVRVIKNASVHDLSVSGPRLEALEVSAPQVGTIAMKLEQLLWTLTSEQTYSLNNPLGLKLFPWGILKPMWYWTCFNVELKNGGAQYLPPFTVIIEHLNEPLTHANMLLLRQKKSGLQDVEIWAKIPYHQRNSRQYIESLYSEIRDILSVKTYGAEVVVRSMPVEYIKETSEIGPTIYPVFDREEKEGYRALRSSQLHLSSSECWKFYELSQIQLFETALVGKMLTLHQKVQKELLKRNRGVQNDPKV